MISYRQASQEAGKKGKEAQTVFAATKERVLNMMCRMLISRADKMAGASAYDCLRLCMKQ